MGLITASAYLKLWNNKVATIIFPDGTESQILVTKNQVFRTAEIFEGISLSSEEVKHIQEQAAQSDMLRNNPQAEKLAEELAALKHDLAEVEKKIREIEEEGEEWKDGQ